MQSASLKNIAEECGVSTMAVSMALRDNSSISKKRRTEIKAIAKRVGYRPNVIARSLRGGKTNSVGLLWSLGGPHDALELIRNVSIRLMHKGIACHMADSLSDPKIIKQCLMDFCSRNIDGVIVRLNEKLSENKEICDLLRKISNVVIVLPDPQGNEYDNLAKEFDVLVHTGTYAIREAVDHFAAGGRKKLAFLNIKDMVEEDAFIEQIKSHNLTHSDDFIINAEDSIINLAGCLGNCNRRNIGGLFLDSLQRKFNKKMPFDALLVSCDEGAVAVTNYLKKIGYKIPEDIAVIGFNNSVMAPYFNPPLASVERCSQDVAESVTNMLLSRIKNSDLPKRYEVIKMKFIHRKSAG